MTTRRRFLGGLAALTPALAFAQPLESAAKPVRVGILRLGLSAQRGDATFVDAMRALGWGETRNIVYDRVYAERDRARLTALAAELVARRPALIHANATEEAAAAFAATRTIPIVFAAVSEPVERGWAHSLARPGGNMTGIANIGWELAGKRVELVRELLPEMRRLGVLVNPRGKSTPGELKLIEQAAGSGTSVITAAAAAFDEIDAALVLLAKEGAQVLLLTHQTHFNQDRKRILAFAAKARIPVIGFRSPWADDGALLSYGASQPDQVRQSAVLVDKVLKGRKPADLPIELPTKFELVINMKVARALSLTIPPSVLVRADRVIE